MSLGAVSGNFVLLAGENGANRKGRVLLSRPQDETSEKFRPHKEINQIKLDV